MVTQRRYVEAGYVYHVLNRGVLRQRLFFSDEDYVDFESLIEKTLRRHPLPILSYQLMPNHWHFVVKPRDKDELSSFFGHLAGTHAKRFRAQRGTIGEGHVYQDRYKTFPVQSDGHFLTLCRYVERNALRAGLVERAELWRWGALHRRMNGADDWLVSSWPVVRPDDWIERVHCPLTEPELEAIRTSIRRGCPLGTPHWAQQSARQLELTYTLRAAGRPRIARPK